MMQRIKKWVSETWNCYCNEWNIELKCKIYENNKKEWDDIKKQIIKRRKEQIKTNEPKIQTAGFILSWLRYIIAVCYLLSFSKWISGTSKKQKQIDSFDLRPYRCIDIYVIVWLCIELLVTIWFAVCNIRYNTDVCLVNTFVGLFCYRLFDIFQSWVSQFVLKSRWEAISINRSLVLAFVGYVEICIIGTFFRYVYGTISMWKNVHYSVTAMIANPMEKESTSLIQYTQIMFAVLFLVVVAQHIMGKLAGAEDKDTQT